MNPEEIMFVKIKHKFGYVDWKKFKSDRLVDSHYSPTRQGGSYFYALTNVVDFFALHKNIFTIFPNDIFYCDFTGSGLVTPHRDKLNTVSMNLYLETDNATTIFYKEINHDPSYVDFKNLRPYSASIDNLVETSRFTAEPNDLYLLNVTEIHGIQKTTDLPRSMITYRWNNYSFDDILKSLKI